MLSHKVCKLLDQRFETWHLGIAHCEDNRYHVRIEALGLTQAEVCAPQLETAILKAIQDAGVDLISLL